FSPKLEHLQSGGFRTIPFPGNTLKIVAANYLQVRDSDFDRALSGDSKGGAKKRRSSIPLRVAAIRKTYRKSRENSKKRAFSREMRAKPIIPDRSRTIIKNAEKTARRAMRRRKMRRKFRPTFPWLSTLGQTYTRRSGQVLSP